MSRAFAMRGSGITLSIPKRNNSVTLEAEIEYNRHDYVVFFDTGNKA